MYALVLAPCSSCGGPLCKGTFSTGFSGLVNEPAKQSKTVGHSIETISTGVALCSYGYGRNHVGTMNGAISGILGAGHGMAERDAAGCPSKSSPAPAHGYGSRLQNLYTVCRLFAKLGFEVFILCADVCLHP